MLLTFHKTRKASIVFAMGIIVVLAAAIAPQAATTHAIACGYNVYGMIGEFWSSLNGWDSTMGQPSSLGCPTEPDEFNWPGWYTDRPGRGRHFEHGVIAWWPFPQGPFMAAMRQPPGKNYITVDWKGVPGNSRRYYLIRWKEANGSYTTRDTQTSFTFNVRPNTTYTIQINGCDDRCYGWLPEVSVTTRP